MNHALIRAGLEGAFGSVGQVSAEAVDQYILQFRQTQRIEPDHRVGIDVAVAVEGIAL